MILILKHIEIEGPGTIADFFLEKSVAYKIIELAEGEAMPKQLNDIDGLVVLGGPMNVYEEDKYPFLIEENKLIQKALKEEIPFLGICLGSQLLAKACGAKVKKAPIEEIGWRMIEQTSQGKEDPIFEGLGSQLTVFQWHGDTFDLPSGSKLLSTSKPVSNQAFKVGDNAYGFQYHIEVDRAIIESWIKEYFKVGDANLSKDGKDMMDQYKKLKKKFHDQAEIIYGNFEKIVEANKAKRINA